MPSSSPPCRTQQYRLIRHAGVTLFELILALALSAMVLAMLGSAIHLHMRAIDTEQQDVTQAQLARAILQQLSSELRGTVNTSLLTSDSKSAAVSSTVSDLASQNSASDSSSGSTTGSSSSTDTAESESLDLSQPTAPGLYGTDTELHFDINRAVPIVPYTGTDNLTSLAGQPLGQLQRISYYVESSTATSATTSLQSPGIAGTGGLVRRAVDHAVAEWAMLNGTGQFDSAGVVIAPEIIGLQFQYFDGLTWTSAWDSQQQAGLPVAVEITLTMVSTTTEEEREAASTITGQSLTNEAFVYQTTVALPASLPTDQVQDAY